MKDWVILFCHFKGCSLQKKLLIVDDEKPILRSLERLFRRSSYTVVTTDSVTEALRLIETEPMAVLLSDYSMPEMSGAALLANAKQIRPEMTRIILSGNSDQAAVIRSINEGGAHRFLSKPWNDDDLIVEIDAAFEQYLSTQYVGDFSGLLTMQALKEKMHSLLHSSTQEYAVLAFAVEQNNLHNLEESKQLQKNICRGIASLPWLKDTAYDLGLLDQHSFCLCITTAESMQDLAEKLQRDLPSKLKATQTDIPLKFRVAYTNAHRGKKPEEVLRECAIALNEIAQSGNSLPVQYKHSHSQALHRKTSLESRLFAALDKSELHLNYQPKIRTSNQTLSGAEALIRWKNPDLGSISPVEFIPVAEVNGLINPIGFWVMKQSIHQWQSWFGDNQEQLRISINVSTVQLEDPTLLASFSKLLQDTGINPNSVELELTETSLMRNADSARDILKELKSLGLHLSIDDFGTGYSSLSYLSQLPIDTIKIDRSFILPMLLHRQSESLVKNIIAMAKDLNKETVAEGVETEAQLLKLSSMGCDIIQGYYFSRPLTTDSFQALYTEPLTQRRVERFAKQTIQKKTG